MPRRKSKIGNNGLRGSVGAVIDDELDPVVKKNLARETRLYAKSIKNPEVRSAILTILRAGGTLADAAKFAGIKPYTLRTWYARGRDCIEGFKCTPTYRKFAADVDKARASAKAQALGTIFAAMNTRHKIKTGETRYRDANGRLVIEYAMVEELPPVAAKAAQAYLASVDPKRWGSGGKQRVELTGADGGPIELAHPDEVVDARTRVVAMLGGIAAAAMIANGEKLPHPLLPPSTPEREAAG